MNSGLINLHQEALYLQGARDLLLQLERMGCGIRITCERDKFANVYNTAVMQELINNRESLKNFYKVMVGDITTTKKIRKIN